MMTTDTLVEGSQGSCVASIAANKMGLVTKIFRESLYNRKLLAPVREYITNAHDANIEAGATRPIEIHCPTPDEPWYSVRDFGFGLDQEKIFQVYFQYFESTKGNDKRTAGHFGIGAKCFPCVSQTIMITSWHGGEKKVYAGVETGDEIQGHLTHSEVSDEPSGVEIRIQIPEQKIERFVQELGNFLHLYSLHAEFVYDGQVQEITYENKLLDGHVVRNAGKVFANFCILHKGVVYPCEWMRKAVSAMVLVPANIGIQLHHSRESIPETDVNRALIESIFKDALDLTCNEFKKDIPEGFLPRFEFANEENVLQSKFLRKLEGDVPKLARGYKFESAYYNFYENNGDSISKISKASYRRTSESQVEITNAKARVVYVQSLGKRTIQAVNNKYPDEFPFIMKVKERYGYYDSFSKAEDFFESVHSGSSAFLVDETEIPLAPVVREKRAKIPVDTSLPRVYNFYRGVFERQEFGPEDTVYYLPVKGAGSSFELDFKGFTVEDIRNVNRKIKGRIVGLNSRLIKKLPPGFRPALPVMKAMRRHAGKAVDWSEENVKAADVIECLEPHFTVFQRRHNWPFRPVKIVTSEKVKLHNKKVDIYNHLHNNDAIFFAAVNTVSDGHGKFEKELTTLIETKFNESLRA